MPSVAEHQIQAERNYALVATLKAANPVFHEWAAVGLFYSSLHYLEAYLAFLGEHPEGHAERGRAFQDHSALVPVWNDYRMLKDYSEDARYRCVAFTADQIDNLEKNEYSRVRAHLIGLLPA
jgi:hypothetical protein